MDATAIIVALINGAALLAVAYYTNRTHKAVVDVKHEMNGMQSRLINAAITESQSEERANPTTQGTPSPTLEKQP